MPKQSDILGPPIEGFSFGDANRAFRAKLATSILIGMCGVVIGLARALVSIIDIEASDQGLDAHGSITSYS
jgi:hypothetical protein